MPVSIRALGPCTFAVYLHAFPGLHPGVLFPVDWGPKEAGRDRGENDRPLGAREQRGTGQRTLSSVTTRIDRSAWVRDAVVAEDEQAVASTTAAIKAQA